MLPSGRLLLTMALFSYWSVCGDDPTFSGPQPGERVVPFRVLQVTGPQTGDELSLLADDVGTPSVIVFVHEATRPGLQLMRPVDLYGTKLASDGVNTHFVWLTADRSKTEDWLRAARASLNLKSPVSISLDGIEGPGAFGLNRKCTLTIVLAKQKRVVANFAIVQPNETDAPRIIEAMAKLAGKPAPSFDELRAELGTPPRRDMQRTAPGTRSPESSTDQSRLPDDPARLIQQLEENLAKMDPSGTDGAVSQFRQAMRLQIQIARLQARELEQQNRSLARIAELEKIIVELVDALNESRATIARLEGKPTPEPIKMSQVDKKEQGTNKRSAADLPGKTPSDPELIVLMRRMIQPTNDDASAQEISAAMLKWVGESPQRKEDLREFAKRIAHLGYGSDAAKKEIKKLAGLD